jgi:4-amino-4-deoxy-L-arabinose transferase
VSLTPTAPASRRPRARLAVVCLTFCVAFLFQGTRGLFETTEGRYAEVGREMVAGGDWMVPHLDGHPHWTKPPLTYWSIAAGLVTVGRNTWGARLYDAFALLVTTLVVGALGAALWDELTGVVAALMFVTIPFVVLGANVVSPDMLLTCFETLAVLCFWRSTRAAQSGESRASVRWMAGMWASFGLAFLTKGPPGLLALLAIVVYAVVSRRRGFPTPRLFNLAGLVLFVVIGVAWYIISVVRDPSLLGYFLGEEVWGRVATGMHHRNARWYMAIVVFGLPLLVGLGAWLVTGILDARSAARPRGWRAMWRDGGSKPEVLFLMLWLVAPLLIFSLSKSRLPLYVLPLVPAQALLLARLSVRVRGDANALRRAWRIAIVSAVLLIALKVVAARVPSAQNMAPLAKEIRATNAGRVTVVDNGRLYGLQFYLDGALRRTTSAELADELVTAASRLDAGTTGCEVLLTGRAAPPLLARRCGNGSIQCSVTGSPDHELWVLRAKAR